MTRNLPRVAACYALAILIAVWWWIDTTIRGPGAGEAVD